MVGGVRVGSDKNCQVLTWGGGVLCLIAIVMEFTSDSRVLIYIEFEKNMTIGTGGALGLSGAIRVLTITTEVCL
jgi:hypothetical protein